MAAETARAWRVIVAAGIVALALRLLFGLTYWVDKPLTHDEREYLALAHSLADGRGFGYSNSHATGTSQQFGRAPGYPAFLAAIGPGAPDAVSAPRRVKRAQALVGAIGVVLIGWIAFRALGPRAAVVAAGLAAAYPPLVWIPSYVLSETLFSAFALGTSLVLQTATDRGDAARSARAGGPLALAAGALMGASILIRPAMMVFLPLALWWLLWRRRGILGIALLAGTVAVVSPWTVRNYRIHGRFVLVASSGGVNFWTGNHPLAIGDGDLAANPEIKRAEIEFRRAHPGLTAEELEPLYYRDALAHIVRHPVRWAGLVARKAFYTVIPVGPSYAVHSSRYRAASIASYLLLLSLALAGVRTLWRSPSRPSALLLMAGSAVLASLVFFPQERYRIPIIDPALIVCASALISQPRSEP